MYSDGAGENLIAALGITGVMLLSVACIIIAILLIIAWWNIFTKAGIPGWHSLIPFLNTYDLYKIAFGNGWMFLLLLIPFVNAVIGIILEVKLGSAFGKGVGFVLGLIFLAPIFLLILGFGNAQYIGPQK